MVVFLCIEPCCCCCCCFLSVTISHMSSSLFFPGISGSKQISNTGNPPAVLLTVLPFHGCPCYFSFLLQTCGFFSLHFASVNSHHTSLESCQWPLSCFSICGHSGHTEYVTSLLFKVQPLLAFSLG